METPTTFHEWIKLTFTWVDNDLKRYMQRSWTASTKAANKRNEDKLNALKAENAKLKGDVEKLKNALRRVKEWSDVDEDYFDDPGDFADHILATL